MIATIIQKESLNQIRESREIVHYRAFNKFWRDRMGQKKHRSILFLSGRQAEAFLIKQIKVIKTPEIIKDKIKTNKCFAITISGRYTWPRQVGLFNKQTEHGGI